MQLSSTIAGIGPLDADAMAAARARQANLTKPPGSLGELEELGVRLAGLAGRCPPPVPTRPAVAVFAGDHGVYAQGVTPWPQEVTVQMVANFLAGGAVINVFARQAGAEVVVVDVGVAGDLDPHPALRSHKIRRGTRDLSVEAALTRDEALAAIEVGIATAVDLVDAGADCLLTGDMGIANTTAAAALVAAFTGSAPARVTGRGTGIDDDTLARKTAVVEAALGRLDRSADPVGVLAEVGGLEHAALAGFVLGGALRRVPVILDGVIADAGALVATALCADAAGALVAGHRSAEPGGRVALDHLGLVPLLDLGLRLGEGSGAVLAQPLVAAAARVLGEVATFDSAGVARK
ncbi:nicotinate-nucleotide--dimethylbenzimidazole phosphoribosyltransferase [Luedemannella helvata]|uniref:Nicotinate-nucleotide--dimethylbenzimidazole phosphoribosyltransferase n=1 Tax=Luedemannella helvata TaxID=349315 RepID=A0ABP4X5R1_9ACTN